VQLGRLPSRLTRGDLDQHVIWIGLGVLDEHVKVTILVHDPRVEKLIFQLAARASPVRLNQVAVGIGGLGISRCPPHP
jgi:hypothetical protein